MDIYENLQVNWLSPLRYQNVIDTNSNYVPDRNIHPQVDTTQQNVLYCTPQQTGWSFTFTPVHGFAMPADMWHMSQSSNITSLGSLTSAIQDPSYDSSHMIQGSWSTPLTLSNASSPHHVRDNVDMHKTNSSVQHGYKRRRFNDIDKQPQNDKKVKYFCDFCCKAFGYYTTFLSHLRTHSGERPFQCTMCHKAFTDRSTLIKHQRIHTGMRPYICNLCGTSFTQSGNLHRHRRRMH